VKILVLAICVLVSTYSNLDLHQSGWSDLIDKKAFSSYEPWYTVEEYNNILYASDTINVRTQPKKESEKIGFIRANEAVRITGVTSNGWYEVSYNNSRGYVSSKYVTSLQAGMPVNYVGYWYYIGAVKTDYIESVIDSWCKVPYTIRLSFSRDGSKIYITDEHLGLKFHNNNDSSILGVTSFDTTKLNCEIFISSSDVSTEAIIHEAGHYFDGKLNNISLSDDFEDIWTQEYLNLIVFDSNDIANMNTSSEYFAEAFLQYCKNANLLKLYCPQTYRFLNNLVESFE
jgi:hypothetical protein